MILDVLTDISGAHEWTAVELVWLVDSSTEQTLKSCTFDWSSDNVTWVSRCRPVYICRRWLTDIYLEHCLACPYLLRHNPGS